MELCSLPYYILSAVHTYNLTTACPRRCISKPKNFALCRPNKHIQTTQTACLEASRSKVRLEIGLSGQRCLDSVSWLTRSGGLLSVLVRMTEEK